MTEKKASASAFSYGAIDYGTVAEDGVWMEIYDADNLETGLEAKVHGEDSARIKKAKSIDLKKKQKIMKTTGRRQKEHGDIDDTELTIAIGGTSAWRHREIPDDPTKPKGDYEDGWPALDETHAKILGLPAGKVIPFTNKAAVAFYGYFKFIPEQVFAFIYERANFTPAS